MEEPRHSRESGVRMKGLVGPKEAIVRQIGSSRSTMRDSHAKVSETCPFSTDFLAARRFPYAAHDPRVPPPSARPAFFITVIRKSVKTRVSPLEFCRFFFARACMRA